MYLLPAIDILDGKAVRLAKGDYNAVTVYNDDPAYQAQLFEEAGANWLHVVDLDGARDGKPANTDTIKKILDRTSLQVEVGGGIRNLEAIDRLADAGVTRVVLGTALVKDPDFAQAALEKFGAEMLAAGIDAKAGEVATEGWLEGSGRTAEDLARAMAQMGYEHLIYTDIARDGMQTGIDPQAYVAMARAFNNPVIASGGVAYLNDIESLAAISDYIEGVIAGRALYEKTLSVEEGVAACQNAAQVIPMPDETRPLTLEDLED